MKQHFDVGLVAKALRFGIRNRVSLNFPLFDFVKEAGCSVPILNFGQRGEMRQQGLGGTSVRDLSPLAQSSVAAYLLLALGQIIGGKGISSRNACIYCVFRSGPFFAMGTEPSASF